ncbi:unnamed protein product [Ectocarpus sp. 12 AP-2014]
MGRGVNARAQRERPEGREGGGDELRAKEVRARERCSDGGERTTVAVSACGVQRAGSACGRKEASFPSTRFSNDCLSHRTRVESRKTNKNRTKKIQLVDEGRVDICLAAAESREKTICPVKK